MKIITGALLSLGLLAAANAAVVISPVGNGSDYDITGAHAVSYRSTDVLKSFDVDGDGAYGTAGYLVLGGPGTKLTGQEFPVNSVSSNAPFVTGFAVDPANTVTHRTTDYVKYDDATLPIGTNVADFGFSALLLHNVSTVNGDWYEVMTFSNDTSVANFRLGIMGGQADDATSKFDPTGYRISFNGGGAVEVTNLSAVNGTIGMVFFDITTDGTPGVFSVEGQRRTSHPSIAGLTFDMIPEGALEAIGQEVTTFPDTAVDMTLIGFSSGGGNLTYTIDTAPIYGELNTDSMPDVTYTPTFTGYQGADSFTFTVSDGISTSDPATVSITMTNQIPIAAAQNVSTFPGTPVAITLTGTDPDGGPDSNLTYFVELPSHGELIGATNMWTYTPTDGYQGADSFTFTVFDGLGTSEVASVSITVTNLLPTADALSASTGAGKPVVITLSGSDPEGSNLTYNVESLPGNGTLDTTLLPDVTYTSDSGFIGEDRFTYSVNDGLVSSIAATVTVSVASAGGVTIAAVGAGTGYDIIGLEAASFFSTNLVKNFDVGSTMDNKYGTDGYYIFGGAGVKNSADYNTAGAFVASVPSFVDAFSADPGATLVRNNTSQTPVDDPSAVSNGMDFAYGGYLMNNGTAGTEDLPMLQFSVNGSEAVSFRLGVLAGNENDTKFDPSAIRLSFADGTTASVSSLESFFGTDPTNHIGMVFFDVSIGAGTIGTFTLAASENSNNPTIAGVTFDVGFVSPSEINDFGIGVVPGEMKVALSWTAVANATYGVEATDDVVFGTWTPIITGIDGINGVLSVTNNITKGQEFYRAYIAE